MALISFGYRIDMFAIDPPLEVGAYIVAYDLDGVLKQKDHLGVVTLVGAGAGGPQGPAGPVGPAGLTWSGYWMATQSYSQNYAVGYGSASWWCISAVTGSSSNPSPNVDTTHWTLLAAQGSPGSQGGTGSPGLQGPQGPLGINWIGDWIINVYDVRDAVYYNGSSYVCIANTVGTETLSPDTNTACWEPLALKGDVGATGSPGVSGATGSTLQDIFYNIGGTVSATNSITSIYRTGSLTIGSSSVNGRFVVSSINGTTSLVVAENGDIYSYSLSFNTKFGFGSLSNNNTGQQNTAFGYLSLNSNTNGLYNTGIGSNSLNKNTLASQNTAVGYGTLFNNTAVFTAFNILNGGSGYIPGTYTGVQLIYSTGSTALTYPSATIVVGSGGTVSSVTIGATAGSGIKDYTIVLTASTSTIGGTGSGLSLGISTTQVGGLNTAVGYLSLYQNIRGSYNVGVGPQSLYNNTIGANNTALGYRSLYNNNGNNNTSLGYAAGQNITSGSGATATNNSVFIGYDTRPSATNNTNEIVIGYTTYGNGSNSVTLGNDSITKTILKGNVGIGLTGPSTKLHIYATQSGAFILEDGTQGNNYILTSDSNGVASWTASSNLGVSLFYNIGGTVSATNSTTDIYRTGSINIGTGTASNSRFVVSSSGGTNSLVINEQGDVIFSNILKVSSGNRVEISATGNNGGELLMTLNDGSGNSNRNVYFERVATSGGGFRIRTSTGISLNLDGNYVSLLSGILSLTSEVPLLHGSNTANYITRQYVSGTKYYFSSGLTNNSFASLTYSIYEIETSPTQSLFNMKIPLSIGTGTASNSRFLVSSSGGTNSLVINEQGDAIFRGDTKIIGATLSTNSSIPAGSIAFGNKTSIYSPGDRQIVIGTDNLSGYNYNYGWKFSDYQITNLWGNPIEVQNTIGTIGNLWVGSSYTIAGYGAGASQKSTLFVKGTTASIMRVVGTGATWSNSQSIFEINNSGAVSVGTSQSMSGSKLFIQSSTSSTTIGSNVMLDLYNSSNDGISNMLSELAFSAKGQPSASDPYNNGHRYALISGYINQWNNEYSGGGLILSTRATTGDSLTERIRITHDGNIGIGTASPSATSKVSINLGTFSSTKDGVSIDGNCGNNPGYTGVRFSLLNTTANASGSIRMYRATGTTYLGMIITSQSRDGISFHTGTVTPTEKMIITAGGNVGVGTASPSTTLHVYATQSGALRLEDGTQGNGYILTSDTNGVATWASTVAVITTTSSITTNTLDDNGLSQMNKCVIIDNGTYSISLTVDTTSGFTSTYLKHGTASISFVQGSGRTLIQVDGTLVLNGSVGSSATIISYGTTDYLRVNNA